MDLGVEPFLISSTLLGAMAQRLVRTICPNCSEPITVSAQELKGFGFPIPASGEIELNQGAGCSQCRGTGFSGRCGIFEIFPMSEQLKILTNQKASEIEIRNLALREGMTPLVEDAWSKVVSGITTYQEALRVTGLT
jgi:general secretion pathway protein E